MEQNKGGKTFNDILRYSDEEYIPLHKSTIIALREIEEGDKRVTYVLARLFEWYTGNTDRNAIIRTEEENIVKNVTERLHNLRNSNVKRINGKKGGRPRGAASSRRDEIDISANRPEDYNTGF